MTDTGLDGRALDLIRALLARRPEITAAVLFGSRAKGTARPASDIDLAVSGLGDPLKAQALAGDLDELPLPYRFDVQALECVGSRALRAHIERVGVVIYEREPGG